MSGKFYLIGFVCLLVAIAVYQYRKPSPKILTDEERTDIALRKIIENRTSSYKSVAVGYVAN